ncbi:zinc ribbon domain-containing protein [Candidatus Enterovibrio escicola]|nr:zinc ribbon domain-containing protein [Candidatus Enterovibrio escacola]
MRTWSCECGITHDRDQNAATNIHTESLRLLVT